MRIAVLADIHSNLEALEAVLAHAGAFDVIWCLGDLVGYAANPNECIARVRAIPHVAVAGNHDLAAVGKLPIADFNATAATAAAWSGEQLTAEHRAYLADLPLSVVAGDWTLVHGSPRHPAWEYLMSPQTATYSFDAFETPYCFIGHTHVPLLFRLSPGERWCDADDLAPELVLEEGVRLIVNPGSVGQPRDADPRASYAILDADRRVLHHYRVPYDVATAQRKIRQAGLPASLAERLQHGM